MMDFTHTLTEHTHTHMVTYSLSGTFWANGPLIEIESALTHNSKVLQISKAQKAEKSRTTYWATD